MVAESNERTAEHLFNLIANRNSNVPNFALLLGSGASAVSGVKTAKEMIDTWRAQLHAEGSRGDERIETWLSKQSWYGDEDEYSILFESVYDEASQRRVYIEECIKDANPSWGYAYLTNLLTARYFDVIFTTNFDDLINEACYLFSEGLRPIVRSTRLRDRGNQGDIEPTQDHQTTRRFLIRQH